MRSYDRQTNGQTNGNMNRISTYRLDPRKGSSKKISDLLWTRQSNMYIYNRVYVNTWQEGHFAWWKWRYSLLEVGERQFLDPWHWARISLSCIQCCKHVGARPFLWTFIFPSNMVLSGNSIIWFSRIQVKIARASKFKNATWLRFRKA